MVWPRNSFGHHQLVIFLWMGSVQVDREDFSLIFLVKLAKVEYDLLKWNLKNSENLKKSVKLELSPVVINRIQVAIQIPLKNPRIVNYIHQQIYPEHQT